MEGLSGSEGALTFTTHEEVAGGGKCGSERWDESSDDDDDKNGHFCSALKAAAKKLSRQDTNMRQNVPRQPLVAQEEKRRRTPKAPCIIHIISMIPTHPNMPHGHERAAYKQSNYSWASASTEKKRTFDKRRKYLEENLVFRGEGSSGPHATSTPPRL